MDFTIGGRSCNCLCDDYTQLNSIVCSKSVQKSGRKGQNKIYQFPKYSQHPHLYVSGGRDDGTFVEEVKTSKKPFFVGEVIGCPYLSKN